MLPYFFPEIVPFVSQPKVYRFGFDEKDLEGNVRAIIEAQFLSMRLHSKWIGEKPEEIYATGGASANREILQVAADIFNTKVRIFDAHNSAALGAAFRSAKSYYDLINVKKGWSDLVKPFLYIEGSEVVRPIEACRQLYNDMLKIYGKYEDFILRSAENPETHRIEFAKKYFN